MPIEEELLVDKEKDDYGVSVDSIDFYGDIAMRTCTSRNQWNANVQYMMGHMPSSINMFFVITVCVYSMIKK